MSRSIYQKFLRFFYFLKLSLTKCKKIFTFSVDTTKIKVYTKNRRGIKGLIASFLDKIGLLNVAKKLIKK